MANLNFNGIIRGGVIRNMQVLGFGANPNPSPPGPTPLQVSTSVRLNPADIPNVGFIPTLTGNTQTLTFSAWIKRSLLSSQQILLGANTDTNNHVFLEFQANDTIRIASNTAASTVIQLITTQVFRDPSQWYHLVLTFDLTNSTQADRVRLYINGARVTTFSTSTLPANTTTFTTFNTAGVQQQIGKYVASSTLYFGGYIADINLVDGQALTPAAFTETDSATGQLIPMTYSGSYGVNGFYLPFGNSATVAELGLDPKTTGQDYPYWPYNTLLINSSSTNGAQNNTFLDSSTNNFSITRNGNTTQGNFTPFNYGGGTTQDNGYYSVYFDGTGDYANVSGSGTSINFGTNDFTIEAWFNVSTLSTDFYIMDTCPNGVASPTNRIIIRVNTSGALQYATFQAVSVLITSFNAAISTNRWNHFALVKSSGSTKLYLNGIQVGNTYADSLNYPTQTNRPILMGNGFDTTALGAGYISNLRIVKGTAVYTSDFTVPTTPLTAIANTSLLTCQSTTFIDNSASAASITVAGNTQPVPANPFNTTFAWSGSFDGSGDFLTIPGSSAFNLSSGSWTVECWFYQSSSKQVQVISSGAARWRIDINTSQQVVWLFNTTSSQTSNNTAPLNQWNHVAVCYNGTTCVMYLNGIAQTATGALVPGSDNISTLYIGRNPDAGSTWDFNGNISNARIVKGTAVYTANFSVPTAPLTAIPGTQLLTCQSSTFVDNSPNAFAITVNGNARTSFLNFLYNNDPINSTPPRQAWSNYFNGGSQLQVSTTNAAFDIAGDFTVEGWFNVTGGYQLFGIEQAASPEYAAIQLQFDANSKLIMLFSQSGSAWALQVATTLPYPFKQWNHLAITRNGSTIRMFQNGSVIASGTLSGALYSSGVRTCINGRNASGYVTGSYSNFRFINGQALYTSNFTPSTEPLTLTSQGAQASAVKLLTCQSNMFVDNSLFRWPLVVGGTPQTLALSPFTPTQAYSAASYGGSMYFDGTGDYLTVASIGTMTGDFTYECWIFPLSTAALFLPAQIGSETSGRFYAAINTSRTINLEYFGVGTITLSGATVTANTWNHLAITRSGSTMRGFINGVLAGSTTSLTGTIGNAGSTFIGASGTGTAPINGYISNLRIVNGTALYTTPFVPPVAPFTNISNTKLLLNATNSGISDASGINFIETVGNAQVSTAVKKWGASSMYFDGTGDYLLIPASVTHYLSGGKDFTIEFWFYSVNTSINATLFIRRASANPIGIAISQLANAQVFFGAGDTNTTSWNVTYTSASNVFTVNTWNHIALTRQGATYRFFLNGVQLYTAAPTVFEIAGDALPIYIASNAAEAGPSAFNGYIQDFRFTVGAARYQGEFTPPAAAFAYNQTDICNQQLTATNISVTAGVGQDNLADSPSDYGTDTGAGGQVRGNYATMSPIDTVGGTFANSNLDVGVTSAAGRYIRATIAPTSGKWYWEATVLSTTGIPSVGVAATTAVPSGGLPVIGVTYSSNAVVLKDSTNLGTQTAWSVNNVVGIAYDADNLTIALYLNNALQTTVNLTTGYTYAPLFMSYSNATATSAVAFNFGQRAFAYAAPTGFKCLVSTNLPTPPLGSTSSTLYNKYMDINLWAGSGANRSIVNSGNMQPDLVWIKTRTISNQNNWLFDSLRGPTLGIATNDQAAEQTFNNALTAFNANGFSLGNNQIVNSSTTTWTYVGWQFKSTPSSVTNTDGSITTTVRANQDSGLSIITYTGTGSNATIGTGLGGQTKFFMTKNRTADSWLTWHSALTGAQYLQSNSTNLAVSNVAAWGNTVPSTTAPYRVSLGTFANCNGAGVPYIAYAWSEIDQYSKMGTYTGNGSTDGPMVYLGFRPRWVMVKSVNAVGGWAIYDDVRPGYNVIGGQLLMSSSLTETTAAEIDFLSNGFKLRIATYPNTATTYLYVAFAEYPFKYARAF